MGTQKPSIREVDQISQGIPTSDGDGVKLTRIIGTSELDMVDPFLLLDMFGTDKPEDYIGGFPSHPHRGFETVTYLLAGRMRHKDSAGHEGVVEPGGVQWMSAARGIVHSEMPEQQEGLLQGFQLWINLPASEKMNPPSYQEYSESEIPVEQQTGGCSLKVIAGRTNEGTVGPVHEISTAPLYLDVKLKSGSEFRQHMPFTHSVIIYCVDGEVLIGQEQMLLNKGQLAVLGSGDEVMVRGPQGIETGREGEMGHILLIGAKRLNEPVARGGPFVMNTKAEVLQAFKDYQDGNF